jgi:ubiquitin C-terminal hydrolase
VERDENSDDDDESHRSVDSSDETRVRSVASKVARRAAVVEQCSHVRGTIKSRTVRGKLVDAESWHCHVCGSTADMWACLTCAFVGCGTAGHFEEHRNSTGHGVCLSLTEIDDDVEPFIVHCFDCERSLEPFELPPLVSDAIAAVRNLQANPPSFGDDSSAPGDEPPTATAVPAAVAATATAAAATVVVAGAVKRYSSRRIAAMRDKEASAVAARSRRLLLKYFERFRLAAEHARNSRKHEKKALNSAAAAAKAAADDDDDDDEDDDDSTESLEPASRSKLPKPGKGSLLLTRSSIKSILSDDLAVQRGRTTRPSAASTVAARSSTGLAPGETGIRNLGNMCYMSAVLQCMSHTPAIRDFFISQLDELFAAEPTAAKKLQRVDTVQCLDTVLNSEAVQKRPKSEVFLTEQLHALFRVLWGAKWSVVTPHSFIEAVWKMLPKYRNHLQHDAQEFLGDIVDVFDRELSAAGSCCRDADAHGAVPSTAAAATAAAAAKSAAAPPPPPKAAGAGKRKQAQAQAQPTAGAAHSHLTCMFRGTLRSSIVCGGCKRVSATDEAFSQLALDLPRGRNASATGAAQRASQAISPRRAPEPTRSGVSCTLNECFKAFSSTETVSQYACDHCKARQTATKSLSVVALPQVLVVMLKRFRWDGNGSKIDTSVTFDLDTCSVGGVAYTVRGLVVHHGRSLRAGHYTAFVRLSGNRWLHINDNKVHHVSEDVVLQQASSVYLLFFQRE